MKSLLAVLIFLPLTSWAAQERGNGGDVVYCPNSTPRAELLDFYEARVRRGLVIPKISGGTYQEKLATVLAMASNRFPYWTNRLNREIANFANNVAFIPGVILRDVPDSDHLSIPAGCEIRQIAIQGQSDLYPGDRYFTVSKDLWGLLDEQNKAGLILHEVLYRIAVEGGAENSVGVRYVNSSLFANQLQTLSDQALMKIFLLARIQEFEGVFPGGSYHFPIYPLVSPNEEERLPEPNLNGITFASDGRFSGFSGKQDQPFALTVGSGTLELMIGPKEHYCGEEPCGELQMTPEGVRVPRPSYIVDPNNILSSYPYETFVKNFVKNLEWKIGSSQTCFSVLHRTLPDMRLETSDAQCLNSIPSIALDPRSWTWTNLRQTRHFTRTMPARDFLGILGNPRWALEGTVDKRTIEMSVNGIGGIGAPLHLCLPQDLKATYLLGEHVITISGCPEFSLDELGNLFAVSDGVVENIPTRIGVIGAARQFSSRGNGKAYSVKGIDPGSRVSFGALNSSSITSFWDLNQSIDLVISQGSIQIQNQTLSLQEGGGFSMDYNGKVEVARFAQATHLKATNGRIRSIPAGKRVEFDNAGLVRSVE